MHDMIGTTYVHNKMNVRVPVVTITPSWTYLQTGVGITGVVMCLYTFKHIQSYYDVI